LLKYTVWLDVKLEHGNALYKVRVTLVIYNNLMYDCGLTIRVCYSNTILNYDVSNA